MAKSKCPAQPTEAIIRALLIIEVRCKKFGYELSPKWFGKLFFGHDHPGWKRLCKCGPKGTARGSGLTMASGAYLGKLESWGLIVQWSKGYTRYVNMTTKGQYWLKRHHLNKATQRGK